jgi:hypothetical protein
MAEATAALGAGLSAAISGFERSQLAKRPASKIIAWSNETFTGRRF